MMRYFQALLITIVALIGVENIQAQDFTVTNYAVHIRIDKEGYFDVKESYDINFNTARHGIYRDILTSYDLETEEGTFEKRQIVITDISVPGHRFESDGKIGQKISGKAQIKIGDPHETVFGPVHYDINYRVENAFLYEKEFTRFYWNLKPPDWNALFNKITFSIEVPEGITLSTEDVKLYSGRVGTTAETNDFSYVVSGNTIEGNSNPEYDSYYGDALTILVNLPPTSIAKHEPVWPFWSKYGWIFILALAGGVYYRVFKKYGEDDPAPMVISYFPPEKMDPAMVGFLIDDKEDTTDLISLLPYWGTKGLIEIEEVENKGWFSKDDTRLIKIGELPADAPLYERLVFNGLFSGGQTEVMVSSLKDSFYTTMNSAKDALKKAAQVYYDPKARKVYWISGVAIVLMTLILAPIFFLFWNTVAFFAAIALGLTLLILNRFMVKKNPKGTQIFSELKGFRQFIKTAELNRLKMLLQESPNYFETTMAYALTFGALESWANKFDQLNIPPPTWYHATGPYYGMSRFGQSFANTMKSTSTTMVSSPSNSSGGGGSSGGGFGGGGGGSW